MPQATPNDLPTSPLCDPIITRTAVRSLALEPRQTCYGAGACLQAVAPFQEQWHGNSTLIRGKFRLRQRQELASHGFHRWTSVGRPKVLAAAQAQPRRDDVHRLAVAKQLQRQGLPRGQDRRGPLGGLLQERPRRMHVGEGAAAKAPTNGESSRR